VQRDLCRQPEQRQTAADDEQEPEAGRPGNRPAAGARRPAGSERVGRLVGEFHHWAGQAFLPVLLLLLLLGFYLVAQAFLPVVGQTFLWTLAFFSLVDP
jgi:hypothetical protein